MPRRVQKFPYEKTKVLEELRNQAGIKIEEMAEYFGSDRDTVRDWELGYRSPHKTRRLDLIGYLLDRLRLRRDSDRFLQIWNDVMLEEWEWEPLSRDELWQYLPNKVKDITPTKLTAPPFLAPPLPPYELVGRKAILTNLKEQLFTGGSLALSALNGLPGVGKTALAVALAHDREVLEHFRDGVLWAGLGRQGDAFALLGSWALELDIPRDELTKLTTIEARAKAIHAKIGMRHMLLVVDDAWQPEAALAFKVGGPNCAHLVTTRIPEVAIYFAGQKITVVHELNETDSLILLERLAPEVTANEPEAAVELVRAIGGLPLGLILIGNHLRIQGLSGRSRIKVALEQLQQVEKRLQIPEPRSPLESHPSLLPSVRVSLKAIIAISDEALSEPAQRTLRALSVFPSKPNTFSEEAAVAVSIESVETIAILCSSGLLEVSELSRYTLHQTITDYAKLNLTDNRAYERMVDFYIHYLETHKEDYRLLDLEINNILVALQIAVDQELQASLVQGVNTWIPFLCSRGLYEVAKEYLNRAQQAAITLNDIPSLATTFLNLGIIAEQYGEYPQAQEHLRKGLDLAREIRRYDLLSSLLFSLGTVSFKLGDYPQAKNHYQEGLGIARELGHRENLSKLFQGLGGVAGTLGDLDQAQKYFREALDLAPESERSGRVVVLLHNLGVVEEKHSKYTEAKTYYLQALDLAREIGHQEKVGNLLESLGILATTRGHFDDAEKYFQDALDLARNRERISNLFNHLGVVAFLRGNQTQAEEYLLKSLNLAKEIEHRVNIISVLRNLGEVVGSRGEYGQAEKYLNEGLDLASKLETSWYISAILNERGDLYIKQRKVDVASTDFLKSLKIAQGLDSPELIAVALYGLARIKFSDKDYEEARRLGKESLTIFETIGHNKASEVKQWLDSLPIVDSKTAGDLSKTNGNNV